MKTLIAAVCFMFAMSPLAMAQDKGAPDAGKATTSKSAKTKKPPSEKQLAQRAKMKSCAKDAKDQKLKGGERKKFMSGCMKG